MPYGSYKMGEVQLISVSCRMASRSGCRFQQLLDELTDIVHEQFGIDFLLDELCLFCMQSL